MADGIPVDFQGAGDFVDRVAAQRFRTPGRGCAVSWRAAPKGQCAMGACPLDRTLAVDSHAVTRRVQGAQGLGRAHSRVRVLHPGRPGFFQRGLGRAICGRIVRSGPDISSQCVGADGRSVALIATVRIVGGRAASNSTSSWSV